MNNAPPSETLTFPLSSQETPMHRQASETGAVSTVYIPDRLPSLDGWRALSIFIVLGSHTVLTSQFPANYKKAAYMLFDGNLGVRFFFVISGFLITWLMLNEQKRNGSVNLRSFYVRRALRILPVYAAFLLVVALLQNFTVFHQSYLAWIGNATFTTNFFKGSHTTSHLWSLAVEEQFYLLWPGIFVFFRPHENWRKMLALLLCSILLALVNRVIMSQSPSDAAPKMWSLFSDGSFFNNTDSLSIGCFMAVLLMRNRQQIRDFILNRPLQVIACSLGLIILPIVMSRLLKHHLFSGFVENTLWIITVLLGRSLQSLGFGMMLIQSIVFPFWGPYRLLNYSVVCQVGILSYSIYIWQQIFCTQPDAFGLQSVWWLSYQYWLVPVVVAACISYYGLERPLLKIRHRFR